MTQTLTPSSLALLTRNILYQPTNMLQGVRTLTAMRAGKPSGRGPILPSTEPPKMFWDQPRLVPRANGLLFPEGKVAGKGSLQLKSTYDRLRMRRGTPPLTHLRRLEL